MRATTKGIPKSKLILADTIPIASLRNPRRDARGFLRRHHMFKSSIVIRRLQSICLDTRLRLNRTGQLLAWRNASMSLCSSPVSGTRTLMWWTATAHWASLYSDGGRRS